MKAWARALRSLARHPHLWRGRVDGAQLQRYIDLTASRGAPRVEQLAFALDEQPSP